MQLAGDARLGAARVTVREAEILAAIGRRLSNREIAARMFISVRTVESHVSSLLRKLGLPDRSALVQLAQRLPGEQVLPVSATSFVGRDEELAEVSRMLAASPLNLRPVLRGPPTFQADAPAWPQVGHGTAASVICAKTQDKGGLRGFRTGPARAVRPARAQRCGHARGGGCAG
jgi:DNA-binding CsgD family transcriptional regulator